MGNKKINSNSIDSIESVKIGGIEQWLSLRSDDITNPIILFLHGGPGSAQISFSRKSQYKLEKGFLVVNWDQRGAGKSYNHSIQKNDMKIENFVFDAIELVEAILKRFKQRKVFLVGHSWGSILGAQLSFKRPDLVLAYIGIGQVVDMKRGEEISYKFTLDEAKRQNNLKAITELQKIGQPPYENLKFAGIQRKWLSKFHGATFKGSGLGTIFKNLSIKDTSPLDIIKFVKGAIFSLKCLEEQQMEVNLLRDISELKVPVYFCSGRRDYNVPFELVIEYLEKLRAPHKNIIWFERSAHMPNFEESDMFCEFCISLLKEMTII
ncbi:alpha/beta fold hydrolase [Clostridium estertheticum]|uniref:alpha/beta fold hydrolase n=1 Tax=Clostridium estertheticum TaxID=238834 RepID=UPI001C7D5E3C|nr:alpha/beta hydrolase [Clostridium estertheticum]MBX4265638.1 alpha/beta hydrolase [Clostridium estertheticum]WLC91020.1 alpha/beta hydrolase [Clostridium estertheticum]